MIQRYFSILSLIVVSLAVTGCGIFGGEELPQTTTFQVRIENISTPNTLTTSSGTTVPVPIAPGVFVVHNAAGPLFMNGQPAGTTGLEALAEDGDPGPLASHVASLPTVITSGVFNTPVGEVSPGPLLPGGSYEFTFSALPGERLSFATMFVQSNDLFYAPRDAGIFLFDDTNTPIQGDITSEIFLWDAGTEMNQEPGLGIDQAPRQSAPNTGASETAPVEVVSDGYLYPPIQNVIRVTISHFH